MSLQIRIDVFSRCSFLEISCTKLAFHITVSPSCKCKLCVCVCVLAGFSFYFLLFFSFFSFLFYKSYARTSSLSPPEDNRFHVTTMVTLIFVFFSLFLSSEMRRHMDWTQCERKTNNELYWMVSEGQGKTRFGNVYLSFPAFIRHA